MTDTQVNFAVGIFYSFGAIMVIIGAILKIQHHPNGLLILLIGFIAGSLTSSYETFRLKKKIKQLEEQLNQKS
jgi:uncharacterized membrane protein